MANVRKDAEYIEIGEVNYYFNDDRLPGAKQELDEKINETNSNVSTNTESINQLKEKVDANGNAISDLTSKIDEIRPAEPVDLTEVNQKIQKNSENISSLNVKVDEIQKTSLPSIQKDIDTLKDDVASNRITQVTKSLTLSVPASAETGKLIYAGDINIDLQSSIAEENIYGTFISTEGNVNNDNENIPGNHGIKILAEPISTLVEGNIIEFNCPVFYYLTKPLENEFNGNVYLSIQINKVAEGN